MHPTFLCGVRGIQEFAVNGRIYVSTLSNAKSYHKQELAMLYKQRWKIELDFRSIKTNMGMEMLRCKTPDMVRKEIAIHLLAYNIIRENLAQAASLHEKIYTNDQRSLVSGLHVLFTVDLATQTKTEIFVDNARVKAVTSEGGGISNYLRPKVAPIQLCAVTLLKVPLISIRRKLQWLTSERNLTQFTESYTGFTESLTMSLTVSLTVSFTVSLTDSLTVSHRFVRHRTRKSCTID